MRAPLEWLKTLVDLPLSVEDLADRLTAAGLEVAQIEGSPEPPPGVITARILEKSPHPQADKLSVCRVWDGTAERQIVCGARNMKEGDGVALAKPGTELPGGVRMGLSIIRGVESDGMLCSEKELGLGEDHDGILILSGDIPCGRPLGEVLSGGGQVLELELTPNRADCLSMVGIAREIATTLGTRPRGLAVWPASSVERATPPEGVAGAGEDAVRIGIEDVSGCRRYVGAVVGGVRVGDSPSWMVKRLLACGIRPINNVVDCTNYVMMELGQPLHAFDRSRVRGGQIRVRRAREGEGMTTLDGVERSLVSEDLVIADGEGPVALAGVMGGQLSSVQEGTEVLFLESASFDPVSVRRTARRLGIRSDASHRFERGVDPCLARRALDRLVELLMETAGAVLKGEVSDVRPRPWQPAWLLIHPDKVARLLGSAPPAADEVAEFLTRQGFRVGKPLKDGEAPPSPLLPDSDVASSGSLPVQPPSFRMDMIQTADLVEEVARLQGYDNLPMTLPEARVQPVAAADRWGNAARDRLVGAGFCEVINYSFSSREVLMRLGLTEGDLLLTGVEIRNPIREDLHILRTLLLPSLLDNARTNLAQRAMDLRLFELRHVFSPVTGRRKTGVPPAKEQRRLAALWTGRAAPEGWGSPSRSADLYDLKGVLEGVLTAVGAGGIRYDAQGIPPFLLSGQGVVLRRGKEDLGFMGRLDPAVARRWGLDEAPLVMEVAFDRLASGARRTKFQSLARFPSVERDLALLIADATPVGEVLADLGAAQIPGLLRVSIADVYRGEPVPEGFRSVLFRLTFQRGEKTLTDAEVQEAMDSVRDRVTRRSGVSLRDR